MAFISIEEYLENITSFRTNLWGFFDDFSYFSVILAIFLPFSIFVCEFLNLFLQFMVPTHFKYYYLPFLSDNTHSLWCNTDKKHRFWAILANFWRILGIFVPVLSIFDFLGGLLLWFMVPKCFTQYSLPFPSDFSNLLWLNVMKCTDMVF